MLLHVPEVLSAAQVSACREIIERAEWVDGNATAGFQSRLVKSNRQLPEGCDAARRAGAAILDALDANPLFASAALPARVFPPLFNRYETGDGFGNHVDNAIRQPRGAPLRMRTDLSATLFLSSPDEYDGGELVIEDTYGEHAVKLPAGDLILYPASSVHRVLPVTRGSRLASFFWVQSLVREDAQRTLLFQMDLAVIRLRERVGDDEAVVALTGVYHNLLRRWASVA
ncbi:MAG TPA: Fe2+-dependent dioxygenase [Gammaproteobacteria bacterium]|nr:Fe2+-dependent dioxygenase [Gammaproteobacteria bacterium]